MKKLLGLVLSSILFISMVGCSDNTSDESNDSSTKVKVEKKKEETNKVNPDNMTVNQDTMIFKLDSVKVIKDYEGKDALEINYTFTNKQEEVTSALVGVCVDGYQNGEQMEIAMVDRDKFDEQINLKKGITQDNCKNYYVLSDDSPVELEVYETSGSAWSKDPATFKINIKDNTVTRTK